MSKEQSRRNWEEAPQETPMTMWWVAGAQATQAPSWGTAAHAAVKAMLEAMLEVRAMRSPLTA
jgi:hypothetical protein